MDSQPEVVATSPIVSMGQEPKSPIPKETVELDVSSTIDSKVGSSQAEKDPNKKSESQEESKDPLRRFREAVMMLAEADLGAAELREAEDEVFEVYVRLKERRRKK